MGSPTGFSSIGELDEIATPVDRGSGVVSANQRKANVLINLGLASGTAAPPTPGTAQASGPVVLDSNKNETGLGSLGVTNVTAVAGTASVAPINLTAGTNLTTAVAGAVEFDGTAFYATPAASTREQLDAEQFILAVADSATYNNTGLDTNTAAPVFTSTTTPGVTNGAVTLIAGKTYFFEGQYILTNTGTTSHTWAILFAGTATLTNIAYSVFGLSSTASTPATGGLTGWASVATAIVVTAASTSATENVTIQFTGQLTVNAGGTFIPQMQASARPGASGTPGVIIKRGSFFRIWQMSGAGFVGNWS